MFFLCWEIVVYAPFILENYFLPNLTSDIDCDFEQGHHCINKYKSNIWRISEENDKKYRTIFDYRWEGNV